MTQNREEAQIAWERNAGIIIEALEQGKNAAFITLGDSMTYSTYGYILAALRDYLPEFPHRTFPGITSYAAAASAMGWPLGVGKERTLILPCPEEAAALRLDIESHDIVVLMKIGTRLPWVLALLRDMGIAEHCAFARRIGLDDELLAEDVSALCATSSMGYLATLLIRKTPKELRHL